MSSLELLAQGYRYPRQESLGRLQSGLSKLNTGPIAHSLQRFVEAIARLSLDQWEELYTYTLDLNPVVTPYVGYVLWGESHLRGEYMAAAHRCLDEAGVDPGGELPDHLGPLLEYLAKTPEPPSSILSPINSALTQMQKSLKTITPQNPYRHLLNATRKALAKPWLDQGSEP